MTDYSKEKGLQWLLKRIETGQQNLEDRLPRKIHEYARRSGLYSSYVDCVGILYRDYIHRTGNDGHSYKEYWHSRNWPLILEDYRSMLSGLSLKQKMLVYTILRKRGVEDEMRKKPDEADRYSKMSNS